VVHCEAFTDEPAGQETTHSAWSGDANKPTPQGVHASDALMPAAGLKLPDKHGTPAAKPANGQYLPLGHATQSDCADFDVNVLYVPAEHLLKFVDASGQNEPLGHVRQSVAADLLANMLKVPALQLRNVPEPVGQKLPLGQGRQASAELWLVKVWKYPAEQLVNAPAASVGTYEPGGALVHVTEPAAANVPALHWVSWVELEHANPAGHVVHILVT
jgi:hypothetical protein